MLNMSDDEARKRSKGLVYMIEWKITDKFRFLKFNKRDECFNFSSPDFSFPIFNKIRDFTWGILYTRYQGLQKVSFYEIILQG